MSAVAAEAGVERQTWRGAASTAGEVVAEAASTADEVAAEETSTADEVAAEEASTADEVAAVLPRQTRSRPRLCLPYGEPGRA